MKRINISVIDQTERMSTLSLTDKGIEVIGVLPHNSVIQIASREDALALVNYISERYLRQNVTVGVSTLTGKAVELHDPKGLLSK